mmetsp:Transcript_100/g.339  ORF Transcript_100/g.339 Transcript_100/m.339 type:complete len:1109 (+) Transcript_100:95-3421(+)|eukprot:CAMPEP_0171570928 /NCGR_PEP_ID=MMETSP0961-20121227/3230_1 /TAXON_ID=87120 /ORGANISM="Aurantiochytrium limacinum, Strain ATCCMYA-1381" /LENGTH=1108 /DNA_ID=CAMNT_0012125499 /DNA_START=25 /DNA_END=3351 /DNA_ORIENTATION=-
MAERLRLRRRGSPPPPPPPPPAPGSGISGSNDDVASRLADKVRRQAETLVDLQSDVEERAQYARLCEQFVVTLEPSQPLPLAKEDLAALRSRRRLVGPESSSSSSAAVNRNSRHTLTSIAKQYDAACKRVQDLTQRTAELEAEISTSHQAKEVADRRVAALRSKLADAQNKVLQLRRGAGSVAVAAANSEEIEGLQAKVTSLEQDKMRLNASLAKEARATEEQRVYIDVLQAALKARAEELGMDPEQVLHAEKAKFDVLAAKGTIARLEQTEQELRETISVAHERLRLENLRLMQTRRRLALYEPDEEDDDEEKIHAGEYVQEAKDPATPRNAGYLVDGKRGSPIRDGRNLQHLQNTNRKLKQENEALLDFVRETVEPLKAEKQELEDALETTASSLGAARKEKEALQNEIFLLEQKLETAKLENAKISVEWNAAQEACITTEEQRDLARAQLEETKEALAKMKVLLESQKDAMEKLRDETAEAKQQSQAAGELAQQLADTQNALRCERRELVATEEKRSSLENKVKELEVARMDLQDRADVLQGERTRLETQVSSLEVSVAQAKKEAQDFKTTCEEQTSERRTIDDELKELRMFKRKAWRIEKAIATLWHEGASPDISLANLQDILQRVSSSAMGGSDEEASSTVMSALENIMPHLNSLLFSAQSLVSRAHSDAVRVQKDLAGQEDRFQVEKRLLHDEIHALRQKFQKVEEMQERSRQISMDEKMYVSQNSVATAADLAELDRLRQRYADLETKYASLELQLHDAEHSGTDLGNQAPQSVSSSTRDFAQGTLRNMRSRIEQASEHAEQLESLQLELEKAASLVREQEEITQQVEAQLIDTEEQWHALQQDVDLVRKLVVSTVKGVYLRYRSSHGGVREFFVEGPPPGRDQPERSLEDSILPLCELVESVLEFDIGQQRNVLPRGRSSGRPVSRQRERERAARIEALNESLSRAQRVVEDTRAQLDSELHQDSQQNEYARTRSFAGESTIGVRSSFVGDHDDMEDILEGDHDDEIDEIVVRRAHSPSRVRVARDGSVQIDALRPSSSKSNRRSSVDLQSSLRDAARAVDQIDRIRKSSSRHETPMSRRYKQQFKVAQDRFRRLQSLDR